MNRKRRKDRKMELRRKGMEVYKPPFDAILTTSIGNLPYKIARHFNNGQILCRKMRGYEFTQMRSVKK
jgi:hypothetical protein